jgi:uncharacterized membrane protein
MSERKFCTNCGAALSEGAIYCSRCGRAVASMPPPQPQPSPEPTAQPPSQAPASVSYRYARRHEKQEKHEKHEKSEKAEKGRISGWTGPLFGGMIVIWLGVTFLLASNGNILWGNWLSWFLTGLGILLVLDGIVLTAIRGNAYPQIGFFIGGMILFLIGFTPIFLGFDFWPLLIVAIGIAIIVSAVLGRRRIPMP